MAHGGFGGDGSGGDGDGGGGLGEGGGEGDGGGGEGDGGGVCEHGRQRSECADCQPLVGLALQSWAAGPPGGGDEWAAGASGRESAPDVD